MCNHNFTSADAYNSERLRKKEKKSYFAEILPAIALRSNKPSFFSSTNINDVIPIEREKTIVTIIPGIMKLMNSGSFVPYIGCSILSVCNYS